MTHFAVAIPVKGIGVVDRLFTGDAFVLRLGFQVFPLMVSRHGEERLGNPFRRCINPGRVLLGWTASRLLGHGYTSFHQALQGFKNKRMPPDTRTTRPAFKHPQWSRCSGFGSPQAGHCLADVAYSLAHTRHGFNSGIYHPKRRLVERVT